jgi:hypothetical protein
MTHVLYWFVGRKGPVKTIDFYRLIGTFGLASVCGILSTLVYRYWEQPSNRIVGLISCSLITAGTVLLVLAILPYGRQALRDVFHSAGLLWKTTSEAPSQVS